MGKVILVTGGACSGKSAWAEKLTLGLAERAVYIATAEAGDGEMAARIAAHQARRGHKWTTHEVPRDITRTLRCLESSQSCLIDCLTLWLSNLIHARCDWRQEGVDLVACLSHVSAPVVVVTNEIGGGIVPANADVRAFRAAAGKLNQMVAVAADEVWLVISGCPTRIK